LKIFKEGKSSLKSFNNSIILEAGVAIQNLNQLKIPRSLLRGIRP